MIDQDFLTSSIIFKKLYDDFVKNNYLFVYVMIRNKQAALRIMQRVFESVFIVDNCRILQMVIRVETCTKTLRYSQEYARQHEKEIEALPPIEDAIEYPPELDMFCFNTSIFHNSLVNTIVVLRVIYNISFKDIARYVNLPCEQVVQEYIRVMDRIKSNYKQKKMKGNY